MNYKTPLVPLLFISGFLFSCNEKTQESITIKVHHFSTSDTIFLFPEKYRRKNYRDREFEGNSKWLSFFDEGRLFDSSNYPNYIRLAYSRAFDNTITILIDEGQVVIKEHDGSKMDFNTHLDSTLLTFEERIWLSTKPYYRWLKKNHQVDSAKTLARILSEFPDIENDDKYSFLKYFKGEAYNCDSVVYIKKVKLVSQAVIQQLLKKIDSTNFWSYEKSYYKSVMDGSGFCLEVKYGNNYNIVNCSNCEVAALIYIRNELLKLTNLKQDEIY